MMASLVMLLPSASAFAPTGSILSDDGAPSLVGNEPQRVYPVHSPVQRTHRRGAVWQGFVADEGKGWHAIFDEQSGVPRTMWGRGIPMPAERDALVREVRAFVERHGGMLGLEGSSLALTAADRVDDTWYLHFDELRGGVPVYRGGISARVKHGNLVLLQVATTAGVPVVGEWSVGGPDALRIAIDRGPAPTVPHTEQHAVRRLVDRQTATGREVRRTWMVTSNTDSPPGQWVTFVDAETGEVLYVHNRVRFVNGIVQAEHHDRNPTTGFVTSPVPLAIVDSGNDTATTDASGAYVVDDGATYTTTLQGEYLTVFASGSGEGLLIDDDPDLLWDDASALQSEIDTYVFTHQVRDWGLRVAPTIGIVTDPLVAVVNIDDSCNAFYNGDINFFRAGGGCNDTGENADVVYHEWGHGFHATSIVAGFFDSSLSEGVADTVAFLQTRDPVIAPGFAANGSGIRDVEPDRIYPQDFNPGGAPHPNGLIFGGTMWDLLAELEALEGLPMGTESLETIFAGLVRGGTDIPGTFGEALVADDDDGDLSNGTPHICEIYDVFGRHGLGPVGSERVAIDHVPLQQPDEGTDLLVEAEVVDLTGTGCFGGEVVDADLHYRIDGGAWTTVAATIPAANPSALRATLPGQPTGTIVEYYVTGTARDDFAVPSGGVVRPYTFLVGDRFELFCWDFELDDGGFTHALLAGEVTPGADDWQWGSPAGRAQDPADAFSGFSIWGNDLGNPVGGNNFNGEYQSDKVNALLTPAAGTGFYTDVMLAYRRWLSVEDGVFDQAEILVNGTTIWQNRAGNGSEHHIDDEWMNHVVALGPSADYGAVQISWQLTSDQSLEFGGWNVDEVCIIAPATPDNRLAINDLRAEVKGDIDVRLTWTHPSHAPVEQVKVVRNFDRFPLDHTDGMAIAEFVDPDLDGNGFFEDTNYAEGDSYYAVYGYDGTAWLSWTVEGWNAVTVDLVGGEAPEGWPDYPDADEPDDPEEDPEEPSSPDDPGAVRPTDDPERGGPAGVLAGCGCTSASPQPMAALLVASLVVVGMRRRRD